MDLTKFLGQDSQEQSAQRLSKEEYAAQKKQEREEIWGMIDGKAQEVFQNGASLKGFLDFMGQCKPQRTDNLFLLYAQNPEIRQVKTFEKWKEEGKVVKTGSKGYNFIVGQEYEKDGVIQQGYSIQKAYDISQIRTKQPEEAEPKPMDQLMEALLTDSEVRIQIADNLPDKVQAQYIPNKRTIYVRNGMSENATFHSISRELACASLDHHDGSYSRAGVSAQAYCAAYVTAQKYGVDVSGFSFDKVCQISEQRLDLRRHAIREFSQQTAGCDVDEPVFARLTDIHLDGLALGNHLGSTDRIFARNLQCPGIVVRRPGRNDTELRPMLQRCDSVDDLIDRAVAAGCDDQVETGFGSTLCLVFGGIRLRSRGICARFVAGPLQNIQNVDKIVFHCFPA